MLYGTSYNTTMYTILRSATFDRWLGRLRDRQAVDRIVAKVAGSRRWTPRRRETHWERRVGDENSVRAWIPGLLHHARH